jgi:hypothetical protein
LFYQERFELNIKIGGVPRVVQSARMANWGTMIGSNGQNPGNPGRAAALAAAVAFAAAAGGCGMSQITSTLGSGVLGGQKKEETAWTPIVTEESMLAAARTQSAAPIDMAIANGCPSFQVQTGDRYVTYYEGGRIGDGLAVTHRGEITRTARECQIAGTEVMVKYGFAGRVLLGPKGKPGTITLPSTIEVIDNAGNKLRTEKVSVVVAISRENPLSYFSVVRDISVPVRPGTQPQDYRVVVAFDRTAPGAS